MPTKTPATVRYKTAGIWLGVCSLNDAYKGLPLQCRQHTCQACHMPQVTHCWRAQTNSAQAPGTVHTIEGARKISAKPTSTLLHCSCCPACTNPNSLRQSRRPPQFRIHPPTIPETVTVSAYRRICLASSYMALHCTDEAVLSTK